MNYQSSLLFNDTPDIWVVEMGLKMRSYWGHTRCGNGSRQKAGEESILDCGWVEGKENESSYDVPKGTAALELV